MPFCPFYGLRRGLPAKKGADMKRIAVPAALILALIFAFAPACAPRGEKPAPTEPVQTASGSEAPEATVLGASKGL